MLFFSYMVMQSFLKGWATSFHSITMSKLLYLDDGETKLASKLARAN